MGLEGELKEDAADLLNEQLKAYSLYNKQIQQNNKHLTRSLMLKPGMQPMLSLLEREKMNSPLSVNQQKEMPE